MPSYYHAPNFPGSDTMRGADHQTNEMFSYLSPEQRVRPDHPLRAIRTMTDQVFAELSPRFTARLKPSSAAMLPKRL